MKVTFLVITVFLVYELIQGRAFKIPNMFYHNKAIELNVATLSIPPVHNHDNNVLRSLRPGTKSNQKK